MDGGGAAARPMLGSCGKTIIHPIMMRFRPIAPKPVVGPSVSLGTSSVDSKNSSISKPRTKRKYVRVRRYNRKKKTTRNTTGSTDGNKNGEFVDRTAPTTTTLQLLPERHIELVGGGGRSEWSEKKREVGRMENDVVLVSDPKRGALELWVTVECVREACMDLEVEEGEIGCTDEERIKNLDEDTCPGFVSNGMNRVEWLNKAFKRMVRQKRERERQEETRSGSESGGAAEVAVWLISNPKLGMTTRVFSCQIKLQFKRDTEMEKDSKVVPCDAWRLDRGGFAWKLDVKAALTLAPFLPEDFY